MKLFHWIFHTFGVFLKEENYKNNTKWIIVPDIVEIIVSETIGAIVKTAVDDAEPRAAESHIFMEPFHTPS